MARALNIGVTAWSPLDNGALTGKYTSGNGQPNGKTEPRRLDREDMSGFRPNERGWQIAEQVRQLAGKCGQPPSQVALNWVRHKGAIPLAAGRTSSANAGESGLSAK